jgi:bifunctional DNA-binding transcriptional regulator/antitoxin component of YhaV-PrlF toxin-antitoxin module
MDSTVMTNRGQISVPSELRKRHNFKGGQRFAWLDDGEIIKLIPIPDNPVEALRGRGKGENLLQVLLDERRKDRQRE